ncbi:MAG TPA: tannase/feruloyl esterase family alpha/beta hydrolase, partial [Gammaproteobacteria bacterium]|nr:tannase/feruloyl esterase family alpha/beta hydrolase [Gammaproteobacteria bacterium]
MLFLTALAAHAQAHEAACSALAKWTGGADKGVQISEARFYTDRTIQGPGGSQTLPPHCHVAGSFERRTGVEGKEYAIGFALNMPANWNGRFMFQGGGGL